MPDGSNRHLPAPKGTEDSALMQLPTQRDSAPRSDLEDAETLPADSGELQERGQFAEVCADHYEMGEELARGGMGRIVVARDKRSNRAVAIKEVLDELTEGVDSREREALIERFRREALVTAGLQHPAIVPVYEVGSFGGKPFFAMKVVRGEPLNHVLDDCDSLDARLRLLPNIIAIAEAIAYAHGKRIIHRDLKPGNILVGAFGETVVIDWGLAKQLSDDRAEPRIQSRPPPDTLQTAAGAVFGTPQYMPVEQARGRSVDERADVYALGAILYQLASGHPPYEARPGCGDPLADTLLQLEQGPPAPLSVVAPDVPADLISIVDKAMARNRSERYRTASELVEELRTFQAGKLVTVHDYSLRELIFRWIRRHRTAVVTAIVGFIAVVALAVFAFQQVKSERDAATRNGQLAEVRRGEADRRRKDAVAVLIEAARTAVFRDDWLSATDYLVRASRLGVPDDDLVVRSLMSAALRLLDANIADLGGGIEQAVFSLDGSHIATWGQSRRLEIWEASGGKRVAEFGSAGHVTQAVLVATDEVIAARLDGTIVKYSVADPPAEQVLTRHLSSATAVRLSSDRTLLASTSDSGLVRIQSYPDGALVYELQTEGTLDRVWFSEGDQFVLAGNRQGHIVAMSPHTRKVAGRLNSIPASVFELTPFISDNGKSLAWINGSHSLTVWDLVSGQELGDISNETPVVAIALHPEGTQIAIATADRDISLWNAQTLQREGTIAGHTRRISSLRYADGGRSLWTASDDSTIRLWDVARTRMREMFILNSKVPTEMVPSPDGTRLLSLEPGAALLWNTEIGVRWRQSVPARAIGVTFAAGGERVLVSSPGSVTILDAATGDRVREVEDPTHSYIDRASANGEWFATTNAVYSARSGDRLTELDGHGEALQSLFSPDGAYVAVLGTTHVAIMDARTGKRVRRHEVSGLAWVSGFDSSSTVLITENGSRLVRLDIHTGEQQELSVPAGGYRRMILDRSGRRFVLFGRGASVWDRGATKPRFSIPDEIRSLSFSPDGSMIAFGATSGKLSVLDTTSGAVSWETKDERFQSWCAEFSPDGTRILHCNGSADLVVRDARTGVPIWRYLSGGSERIVAAWAPSGDSVVSTSDSRVRLHDVRLDPRTPEQAGSALEAKLPRGVLDALRRHAELE